MSISSKILPVLALAVVLSPLAAQAQSNPQPGLPQLTPSSATIDNVAPAGLWDGRLSGQTGANSTGGGNRYSYTEPTAIAGTDPAPTVLWDGGQYAPNAVASADPTQNGFAGEGYGANSAGGGNRASADYGGQYAPNAVASADPTQNGFAGESYGANSAGGGNR
jgi:hypothetical protein